MQRTYMTNKATEKKKKQVEKKLKEKGSEVIRRAIALLHKTTCQD